MSRPLLLVLALGTSVAAQAGPFCGFATPKGWSNEAAEGLALVSREPPSSGASVRATLSLRAPMDLDLTAAAQRAQSDAQKWLTGRKDVELVRDEPLPGGDGSGRLLVYHYRLPGSRWFGLRYYALIRTAAGVAELTADSPATYIDALRGRKYMEASAYEAQIVAAIQSTKCTPR